MLHRGTGNGLSLYLFRAFSEPFFLIRGLLKDKCLI